MQRLSRVGMETGSLTDDEIKQIDRDIVLAVHPALVGRTLFRRVPLADEGVKTWVGYTETDMSQAVISMDGLVKSMDRVALTEVSAKVPMIHKDVKLFWRDIIASRRGGIPIDTINVNNAARQIAEEEDKLLLTGEYTGWKAYSIKGLATATSHQTQATAGAWGTVANILTDMNAAIALLESAGFQSGIYDLILRSAQAQKLWVLATNTGIYMYDLVKRRLGGRILVSDSLYSSAGATTSGLVVDSSPGNFDLGIATDPRSYPWKDSDMNTMIKVYEILTPRINRPTAIVELTGLS